MLQRLHAVVRRGFYRAPRSRTVMADCSIIDSMLADNTAQHEMASRFPVSEDFSCGLVTSYISHFNPSTEPASFARLTYIRNYYGECFISSMKSTNGAINAKTENTSWFEEHKKCEFLEGQRCNEECSAVLRPFRVKPTPTEFSDRQPNACFSIL